MYRNFLICLLLLLCFDVYANDISDLMAYERNVINVFQNMSKRVVNIHRLNKVSNRRQKSMQIVHAGSGSGVIWNNKGYIVTNYHVVRGGDIVSVSIGKITAPAKLIFADPRKDIAVLRVTAVDALLQIKNYPEIKVASSRSLLVGQSAIAIGNPYGLDHSLSVGVISALNRQIPGAGGVSIQNMIQTDAAVNPGNSGGPLLDSSGRLIGINTVIFSRSGASAGVGFAIPGDDVKNIMTQVIKYGRVKLAGIGITPLDYRETKRLGVETGVLISDVMPNSPAQQAHLRPTFKDMLGRMHVGDIIVAVAGKPVNDYDNLYNVLSHMRVGQEFTLTILRDHLQIYHNMKTIDIAAR